MARRLHMTTADYMVLAVTPALIIVLVGSLVYFLLEVVYQGQCPGRLKFCLSMFVFASVLIGRISMEEGLERAIPFGAILTILVGIAMNRFIEYPNAALANVGWMINWSLMGVSWWCAYKLTWDCTWIEDGSEPSNEGLLQTIGLDKPETRDEAPGAAAQPPRATIDPPQAASLGRRALNRWEQLLEERRRPHAPGVWVVYFSLAALPLFGVGQLLISTANLPSRRYAFWLLGAYVASALGLLLTTSFLGLRRYLRQRRLEMPAPMAGTWLAMGAALILVLLMAAAMVPRPGAEYAISQLPFAGAPASPEPSDHAVGASDARRQPLAARTTKSDDPGRDPATTQGKSGPPAGQTKDGQPFQAASNGASEQSSSDQNPPPPDKSNGESTQSDDAQPGKPSGEQQSSQTAKLSDKAQTNPAGSSPANSDTPPAKTAPLPPSSPPLPPPAPLSSISAVLAPLIKLIFYAVLIAAILYGLWRYWDDVLALVRQLAAAWRELWSGFSGRKKRPDLHAADAPLQLNFETPLSDYRDPFASGDARRYPPEQIVKYTFEALEAWGRQYGCPRQPDETPHEFAAHLGAHHAPLAHDAAHLADLYGQVAYASQRPAAEQVQKLARLWQTLRTQPLQTVGSSA